MVLQEVMNFPRTRSIPPPASIEEVKMLTRQPGRHGGVCEQLPGWEGDRGPDGHRAVSADEKLPLIHRQSVM